MAEDTSNAQGSALTTPAGQRADTANPSNASAPQARVALIGRAGAGKTALARALFGAQLQPTAIGSGVRYQDAEIPLVVDDLPGWTHGEERDVAALFAALETQRAAEPPLVAIWYALDAVSARVTNYELQVIGEFAHRKPLIVVLTRSDLVAAEALAAMQTSIEEADIPNCLGVVAVAADPLPALGVAPYGIGELVELTAQAVQQAPSRPAAQPAARPADHQQARQAPGRDQTDQTTVRAQRDAPREQFTREQSYAEGGAGQTFAATESGGDQSGAMVALVIVVSLALALLLLWRRLRNSAPEEE